MIRQGKISLVAVVCLCLGSAALPAVAQELTVDPAEAEAALAVLAKRRAGEPVGEEDWQRIFSTDGYRRLAERERSMDRSFEEADLRAFLMGEDLPGKLRALESTLAAWTQVDFAAQSHEVLDFLPAGARLRATIYPVVKPQTNSFVFDLDGDPAIFLYLDPEVGTEKFTNTVLHELHHIGFGGACPPPGVTAAVEELPPGARRALRWLGAFGEGFAMLAAAGGPDVHPHATSSAEERRRWDADIARFAADRREVEAFLLDLVAGRLDEEQELAKARSFYGVQGPWYTVGWKMAVTIDRVAGREELITAFCDPRRLLPAYNAAARQADGDDDELWSRELLTAIRHEDPIRTQRPTYALADPFLQFHYAILEPHGRLLRDRDPRKIWSDRLSGIFDSRVRGPVFEELARTWIRRHAAPATVGGSAGHAGPSMVTIEGTQYELDLVVSSADEPSAPPAERTILALGETKAGETVGSTRLRHLEKARAALGTRAVEGSRSNAGLPRSEVKRCPQLTAGGRQALARAAQRRGRRRRRPGGAVP